MSGRVFSLIIFIFVSCSNSVQPIESNVDIKVLFVGNSLTYTNDLPAIIKELGSQDGVAITYSELLFPNYSFEDHWNDGKVQKEIATKKYDYVVAQQGPSALQASQVLLLDYSGRLAELCKTNNAKLALYMVWPSADRGFDLDNVIFSYSQAAVRTGSLLCPVGLGWKYAWEADTKLPLYSMDNFHPSMTGSVLAALIIYGALKDKKDFDFIVHNSISWKNDVSAERLIKLKEAALKALNK
jgi:hypothetical protein